MNRAHELDRVRSPLSSILPPTANLVRENDPVSPEHTQTSASCDSKDSPNSSPPDETFASHLGERQALFAAEKSLSRSLTMACGEDGVTLNTELGPTILLPLSLDIDL